MTQIQKLKAETLNALFFTKDSILIEEITALLKKLNQNILVETVPQLQNIITHLTNVKGYKPKYLDHFYPEIRILSSGVKIKEKEDK